MRTEMQAFIEYHKINDAVELNNGITKICVQKGKIKELLSELKNSPEFSFDMLLSMFAVDNSETFEVSYLLYSTQLNINFMISTEISRIDCVLDSICDIFPSANWDEREIFDLFGISFALHPNMSRILLPKDWLGHPLRKDYVLNDERLAWNK